MGNDNRSRLYRLIALVWVSSAALFSACETSVDPVLPIDRSFAMWGFLNAHTDTHSVRIFEIQDSLYLVEPYPLDVEVTSTNLTTGHEITWADSLVQLADGDYRNVFWTVFPTAPGETYAISAVGSDGSSCTARTSIPDDIQLKVLPGIYATRKSEQRVKIIGSDPNVVRVDLAYRLEITDVREGNVGTFWMTRSYSDRISDEPGELEVMVDYYRDYLDLVIDILRLGYTSEFVFCHEVELQVHVGDKHWVSPVGSFDPEILVEPGLLSNVRNGFGFVGAGYVETIRWVPKPEMLEMAGFDTTGFAVRIE